MILSGCIYELRYRNQLYNDKGPYNRETSPLIFSASQWTGLYVIETSVMKELSYKILSSPRFWEHVNYNFISHAIFFCIFYTKQPFIM